MEIKEITQKEASSLIATAIPIGLFYLVEPSLIPENNVYTGFDNSTGDVWVEEFHSLEECTSWLLGRFEIGDEPEVELTPEAKPLFNIQVTHYFKIIDAGMYGGADSTGYALVNFNGCKLEKCTKEALTTAGEDLRVSMSKELDVPLENIIIISFEEYKEAVGEENDLYDDTYESDDLYGEY